MKQTEISSAQPQGIAVVFYETKKAGILKKIPAGYQFEYDPDYLAMPDARPISLSLPLKKEKYESPKLFSFFDGLLPEGWLLEVTCSSAKIDKNDKFRLLLHTGADPVGSVSIQPLPMAATNP